MVKRGLGRGLGALLPAGDEGSEVLELELDAIVANKRQPREGFDNEKLAELAASIREHGVLQPVIVRETGPGRYMLVAGERRWRASKLAGLQRIPAIVRQFDERQQAEVALIENLQRDDLSPLEEARAYAQLLAEFGLTQEEMAQRVGKSRPAVANALRLLQLPPEAQELLRQGRISSGHARALLGLGEPGEMKRVARLVAEKGLNVRETEKLVRAQAKAPVKGPARAKKDFDYELGDVIARLQDKYGTKVVLRQKQDSGCLEIHFYSSEELYRLVEELLGIGQA